MSIKKIIFLFVLVIMNISVFFVLPHKIRENNSETNYTHFENTISLLKEMLVTDTKTETLENFFQSIIKKNPNLVALIFSNESSKEIIFSKNKKYIEFSKETNQFSIKGNNLVLFSQNLSPVTRITIAYFIIEPQKIILIVLSMAICLMLILIFVSLFLKKKQKLQEERQAENKNTESIYYPTHRKIHPKENLYMILENTTKTLNFSNSELCAITLTIHDSNEIIKSIKTLLESLQPTTITIIAIDFNKFLLLILDYELNAAMVFSENLYQEILKISQRKPKVGIGISFSKKRKNYERTILTESNMASEKAFEQQKVPIVAYKL